MAGRGRQERAWVRAAREGSAPDLEALFELHWPEAYRAAYLVVHDRTAAEDIAQEAFVSIVRHLDDFDRRRQFGPWLQRIVVNRAIDWARTRATRKELLIEDGSKLPSPEGAAGRPESRIDSDAEAIVAALAALSPEQRAVVVLRYLLEYTPGEIAELLELPRGTVNSRLRRGLDLLRLELSEGSG